MNLARKPAHPREVPVDNENGPGRPSRMLGDMTSEKTSSPRQPLPPITDADALHQVWRHVMGRPGFRHRTLWMLLIAADGRPVHAVQLDEAPRAFEDGVADNLVDLVRELHAGGLTVAFLYSRPGPGPRTADDMTWANGLTAHLRRNNLPTWPVHLANDSEIAMVRPDDLAAAG